MSPKLRRSPSGVLPIRVWRLDVHFAGRSQFHRYSATSLIFASPQFNWNVVSAWPFGVARLTMALEPEFFSIPAARVCQALKDSFNYLPQLFDYALLRPLSLNPQC